MQSIHYHSLLTGIALLAIVTCTYTQPHKHLVVGDTLPAFSLPDQDGNLFNSKDMAGKKLLVIYFYPKDESAVCTKEACAFRDKYTDLTNAGALVVAINAAPIATHKTFQQHHHLPFTLLSDSANTVLHLFGVKSKFFLTGRETFVVDLQGKIVYTFNSMLEGTKHAEEALQYIQAHKAG